MTPDITLDSLSVEQLISALNEKLCMECARVKPTMPPVSRARVATLAAEVDALEKRAKDILHKVVCLKNPLQPANRLPPEIIALCATFVPRTSPKRIVTLTHVCRYWREAITSSPGNWTLIGSGWKRWVPLFLERAGAALMTVKISVSDIKGREDFLQALLPHVSRISNLSIIGYPFIENVADNLPGFFTSPMPNLSSLKLKQTMQPADPFPSNETPAPPVFRDVLRLKSLHLTRVPLYPTLSNIPSLAELKLTDYTIPFGGFIGFLESNLALGIINLSLGFAKGSVSTLPNRTVSLPRLRHLALTCDNAIDSRGLLSCLSLPRGVNIGVRVSQRSLHCHLVSFLPHPPTPIQELLAPITTIKHMDAPKQIHLSGNNSSFIFHSRPTPEKANEEFDLFATGAVLELHLGLHRPENRDLASYLPWALERLPALEVLTISRVPLCSGSLSALTKEPISCRSLKTVAFLGCEVTSEVITELEGISAKRKHSMAARLYRIVIVNNGHNLPDLRLVKQLRKFVPHVDVAVGDELPDLL